MYQVGSHRRGQGGQSPYPHAVALVGSPPIRKQSLPAQESGSLLSRIFSEAEFSGGWPVLTVQIQLGRMFIIKSLRHLHGDHPVVVVKLQRSAAQEKAVLHF